MTLPFRILSTDFDGTLHADFETPPIPVNLQKLISGLQARGVLWVINTGRDLSSLMETLGRAHIGFWPDYVVTVEREIYKREDSIYTGLRPWNERCATDHEKLFSRVRQDVSRLEEWIRRRFTATIYEDPYSPFCLIAQSNKDADTIHEFLEDYCRQTKDLTVVRNDIYIRFSHIAYNKGRALAEIGRLTGIGPDQILAAGDHLNDLPMLSTEYARFLVSPSNAIPVVKEIVLRQQGYVSELPHGTGVADGIESVLRKFSSK